MSRGGDDTYLFLALVVAAGAALWYYSPDVFANDAPADGSSDASDDSVPLPTDTGLLPDDGSSDDSTDTSGDDVNEPDNVNALLQIIRDHESGNVYNKLYGGKLFSSYADHPSFTGWAGVVLPDATCKAVNLAPGCKTTAAGAYQFISSTWKTLQNQLSLPDFSPESQDMAAVQLLKNVGAYTPLVAGDIEGALQAASTQWASLPYSSSGQPKASLGTILGAYKIYGGTTATDVA